MMAAHPNGPLDHSTFRRRVFETPGYGGSNRFVVKRTVPLSQLSTDRSPLFRPDVRDASMFRNEILAIQYVKQYTSIPVPTIITSFEDRDSVYLVQEYVEGAIPATACYLPPSVKDKIVEQLENYVAELHALTDPTFRSFVGPPMFPYRLYPNRLPLEHANYQPGSAKEPYVLCHGDLGWQNILIDPETYDIKCIIDWEFAGFYPVEFESEEWRVRMPSVAIGQGDEPEREVETTLREVYARAIKEMPAPERSEQVLDATEFTPTQLKIRRLDIGFPAGRTVSGASLAAQTAIAAHQGIADDLDGVSKMMKDGHATLADMIYNLGMYERPRPGDRPINTLVDYKFFTPLTSCLPSAFTELSLAYRSAISGLIPLRDHLIGFTETQLAVTEKHNLPTLVQAREIRKASFKKWDEEQKRQEPIIEARRQEEVGVRIAADHALKGLEEAKWRAIKKFAERLLHLSHAAEALLPYMPDADETPLTRENNRDRYVAEQRVQDIRQGGTGGWAISIVDDGADSERIKKEAGGIWDKHDKAGSRRMLM